CEWQHVTRPCALQPVVHRRGPEPDEELRGLASTVAHVHLHRLAVRYSAMDVRGALQNGKHPLYRSLVLPPVELAAYHQVRKVRGEPDVRHGGNELLDLRQVLGEIV